MANTSELEKGLNELKRLTGITLAVTAEDSEQKQMALEQIRCLCLAYREKYNKNDNWYDIPDNVVGLIMDPINGNIATNESLHKRILYYLKGTEPKEK